MPIVSHAVLDQIRVANDIVGVIGAYFQLHRNGANFKALCPFHKEKTPSFMVNPQRQTFHCFGCGAGGDVFTFVMNYEKVDFMTAVKMLAQKANIRLAFENASPEDKLAKDVLYEIMAGAAGLYHNILMQNPEAGEARNYLKSRDLHRKTAEEFLIGYAPDRFDTIAKWAGKKYQRSQLEAAGLIVSSTGFQDKKDSAGGHAARVADRFRGRVMFPIRDEQGRVVGFSGRILKDDPQAAKYVNTQETPLFHKGRLLYALDKARKAIVEQHEAIVCEGQIDVIRCHLAGFNHAVAAQGTAFTDDHARILKRYADGVILAFDPDAAGQKAAIRASETFLRAGLAVRAAVLPKGFDPDMLLQQDNGKDLFREILDKAKSVVDFQVDVLSAGTIPKTEADLIRISSEVMNTVAHSSDAVQRAGMLKNASRRLGIPEHTLATELGKFEKRRQSYSSAPEDIPQEQEIPAREMALLEHLLSDQKLSELVKKYLPLDLVTHDACRQIMTFCIEAVETKKDVMGVIAGHDDEARTLTMLAARAIEAPKKIKSDFATHDESVKLLILALRRETLMRQKKEMEVRLQAMRLTAPPEDDAEKNRKDQERKQLEIEHSQMVYDLAKLKHWDTALPILELI